jgi:UDP-N-acetylglucosamine 4,6-dehydratase
MRVVDLAEAIAPGVPRKVVGIRPGEKLHEVLLSEDEARIAAMYDDRFIISARQVVKQTLPDGFRYSSDNNTEWLTVEELRRLVG